MKKSSKSMSFLSLCLLTAFCSTVITAERINDLKSDKTVSWSELEEQQEQQSLSEGNKKVKRQIKSWYSRTSTPTTPQQTEIFVVEDHYVIAFCAGYSSFGKAGIGVWFADGHVANLVRPILDTKASKVLAELHAVIFAFKILKKHGFTEVKIFTDSTFVVNAMTKWMQKWKQNNFLTVSGQPVKNQRELVYLDALIQTFKEVKWATQEEHPKEPGFAKVLDMIKQSIKKPPAKN